MRGPRDPFSWLQMILEPFQGEKVKKFLAANVKFVETNLYRQKSDMNGRVVTEKKSMSLHL